MRFSPVVHADSNEWWGLDSPIRDVCDRFAAEGFFALAPDLFRGETTATSCAPTWAEAAFYGPRSNQSGRSFQSCAMRIVPVAARSTPVIPWCTRWPQTQTRRRSRS